MRMSEIGRWVTRWAIVVAGWCASHGASVHAADWPQWRGPNRDGISQEKELLAKWPDSGPPLAWKQTGVGAGYAGVVIAKGRIYTLGDKTTEGAAQCHLSCLDLEGQPLWATPFGGTWGDGGPRSTPTVDGDHVYGVSPHGDIACLATSDGHLIWKKSMSADLGGHMMSGWGYCESVLIDGDMLICTPGGDKGALVALNKNSGDLVWQAEISDAGGAGYASVVTATVGGVKQYVTLLGKGGGLVSVRAKDGKFLWRHNKVAGGTANVATPVVKGDLVFYTTGYGDGGSALLKMTPAKDGVKIEEKYVKNANELRNHHGGVVLVGEYLYGGHGQNEGLPFCLRFEAGKETWKRGRGPGGGSAAVIYADQHLYFRYEDGVVALLGTKPGTLEVKSKFQPEKSGSPAWAHPAISDGKLYLRDQDMLMCYDIRKNRTVTKNAR